MNLRHLMIEQHREIEAKFCARRPPPHLPQISKRILGRWPKAGGDWALIQPRTLEVNLRFDHPNGELTMAGRTLRLRKDTAARLTYKDNGQTIGGAISRREIEFVVSDFDAAKQFIEALGYEVAFIYEKYRTTYEVEGRTGLTSPEGPIAKIMVDELPYGNFVEIEGDLELLRPIAEDLGLDWGKAIPASYFMLFERLRKARGLNFRDLTFENFRGIEVAPEEMGIEYADQEVIT